MGLRVSHIFTFTLNLNDPLSQNLGKLDVKCKEYNWCGRALKWVGYASNIKVDGTNHYVKKNDLINELATSIVERQGINGAKLGKKDAKEIKKKLKKEIKGSLTFEKIQSSYIRIYQSLYADKELISLSFSPQSPIQAQADVKPHASTKPTHNYKDFWEYGTGSVRQGERSPLLPPTNYPDLKGYSIISSYQRNSTQPFSTFSPNSQQPDITHASDSTYNAYLNFLKNG